MDIVKTEDEDCFNLVARFRRRLCSNHGVADASMQKYSISENTTLKCSHIFSVMCFGHKKRDAARSIFVMEENA